MVARGATLGVLVHGREDVETTARNEFSFETRRNLTTQRSFLHAAFQKTLFCQMVNVNYNGKRIPLFLSLSYFPSDTRTDDV